MSKTKQHPCPWPKPFMRDTVKRAMARIGGADAFAVQGRVFQEAIIDQAIFTLFFGCINNHPTQDDIAAARRVAYEVAGLWDEDDDQ